MSHIRLLAPVTIPVTDVCYAQGAKAGNWVFLTGTDRLIIPLQRSHHEAGLLPEMMKNASG